MSDDKKANLFAKLAAQNVRPDQPASGSEPIASDDSPPRNPSAQPPAAEVDKPKLPPSRKKTEPVSGKRGNPDYCQANSYISKKVRKSVNRVLLDMDGLDYSTLVEDLLKKWLKSKGVAE